MLSRIGKQRWNIVDLDENTPFYENMMAYFTTKINCLWSYRTTHDVRKGLEECSDYISARIREHPSESAVLKFSTSPCARSVSHVL